MENTITGLLATYRFNGIDLRRADPAAFLADVEELARMADTFLERREAIKADVRLTQAGRSDAMLATARHTLTALEAWSGPKLSGLAQHEDQVRAKLSALIARPRPTDANAAFADALVRSEIRRAAADVTDAEAEVLFRNGDGQVRDALGEGQRIIVRNGAAVSRPFISPETRDAVLLETALQASPELADELHDIREVRSGYTVVAGMLQRMVDLSIPSAPGADLPTDAWILANAGQPGNPAIAPSTGILLGKNVAEALQSGEAARQRAARGGR